jgi:hypothetical protein
VPRFDMTPAGAPDLRTSEGYFLQAFIGKILNFDALPGTSFAFL